MTLLARLRALRTRAADVRARAVHASDDDALAVCLLLDDVRSGTLDTRRRDVARAQVRHRVPGVRRGAARVLEAFPHPDDAEPLGQALADERAPDVALALARAARACGADSDDMETRLRAIEELRVATIDGWRRPWATAPLDLRARFHGPVDPVTTADPSDGPATGRRAQHRALASLGRVGHPDALPALRSALEAMDDDPGHAFAQRRVAARALGEVGLPRAAPWLRNALESERRDHEGRPGAGMGIQFPVRATLLLALGMVQDNAAVPLLIEHLDAMEASPLGGLHLPAMAALVMIGPPAAPALRAATGAASSLRAAHAFAVLHALGQPVPTRDPRPPVASLLARLTEAR